MRTLAKGTTRGFLAVLVSVVVACSGADDDTPVGAPASDEAPMASSESSPSPKPTREPSEPEPTEAPSEDEATEGTAAVLDAYQGYWDAVDAANDPPDQFHPALKRYATGEAYESVFNAAQTNRLAGRALRLPEGSVSEHRAEVVSIDGDTAMVRDCAIDDGLVVEIESGEVLDDDVVTRLVTGTLERVDGQWKVSHTRIDQRWDGVAGCAVE